jgi:hypothetical protein
MITTWKYKHVKYLNRGISLLSGILLMIFMGLPGRSVAQDIPPDNPYIDINIVSGNSIEFVFNTIEKYVNGIMDEGQSTYIRIGCITDWKLEFSADQAMFYGTDNPTHQMELNNVGITIQSTGTNQDDGSNILNYAKNLPVALASSDALVLTKGSGTNKGYGIKNSFIINWEMGTRRGNMNSQSIFEQWIPADIYTLNVIFTVSIY